MSRSLGISSPRGTSLWPRPVSVLAFGGLALAITSEKEGTMAVKHVSTNEIHSGFKGGKTGCGFKTQEHPTHWVSTKEKITCGKRGCK